MKPEPIDEPTVAFSPTWDPVWDDEPRRPEPARAPAPEPSPPLSALLPAAARPAPEQEPVRRQNDVRRNDNGRGRTWLVLARFRALISLIVVVVFSGVALAAAVGLAVLAVGLALRQVAGT